MKYTVRRSVVQVIGPIWMPAAVCAMEYTLTAHDLESATDDETGTITRDSLERWIMLHTGDFSGIDDWSASLELGDETVEFDWSDPESEYVFLDQMCPCYDE